MDSYFRLLFVQVVDNSRFQRIISKRAISFVYNYMEHIYIVYRTVKWYSSEPVLDLIYTVLQYAGIVYIASDTSRFQKLRLKVPLCLNCQIQNRGYWQDHSRYG